MNDIDTRIMHAVNEHYREKNKPPALCVVHPLLYRNKTLYDVRIPLLPEMPNIFTFDPDGPIEPQMLEVATVRIVEMDTRDRWVPPEQWIICLTSYQVMSLLLRLPHLMQV